MNFYSHHGGCGHEYGSAGGEEGPGEGLAAEKDPRRGARRIRRQRLRWRAEVSGFSVGHIYNVIGKKDALFEEVVSRELDEMFDTIDDVFERNAEGPASVCIDNVIDTTLTFFDSHNLFFQVYLNETDGKRISSKRLPCARLGERLASSEKRLRRLFKRAIDEGVVADLSPNDLATFFDEIIKGFIGAWAADGYRGKISKKAKVIKQVLWHGIHR